MSLIFPEFTSSIVQAQQAYGACILSFLGAIHWGYALAEGSKLGPSWSTLSYSVSPSLIAWTSLLLHPVPGLMTLCVGLAFALSKDLKITHFPAWYHALRKALSTLAVASLGFTGVVFYFHWTEKAFDMLMWKVRRESQENYLLLMFTSDEKKLTTWLFKRWIAFSTFWTTGAWPFQGMCHLKLHCLSHEKLKINPFHCWTNFMTCRASQYFWEISRYLF